MNIAIWYQYTNKPFGGSNNFLRRLGIELEKQGHNVIFGFSPMADAIIVNAFVNGPNQKIKLGQIAQINAGFRPNLVGYFVKILWKYLVQQSRRYIIVHRVDGVTALYGRQTPEVDDLTIKINHYTDLTIFQSQFCHTSFIQLGMAPKKYTIINNGVPSHIFYPARKPNKIQENKIKLIAVSWSSNPMKGFETLAKISLLKNVSLTFVGNWPKTVPAHKTKIIAPLSENEIAKILRTQNAFVHAAINDPSSNAIIEALASGLPVLYTDSGGNKELVKDCGIPIQENLELSVNQLINNFDLLQKRVLNQLDRFSIRRVAENYISAIQEAIQEYRSL